MIDLFLLRNHGRLWDKLDLELPSSDIVIWFLSKVKNQIWDLTTWWANSVESTKVAFILYIEMTLQARNLDKFSVFSNGDKDCNYKLWEHFMDLEDLYGFLKDTAEKEEEKWNQIKHFIEKLPSHYSENVQLR